MAKTYLVTLADGVVHLKTGSLDKAKAASDVLDQQGKQNSIGSYTLTTVSSQVKPKSKPVFNDLAIFGELSPFAF